ncbi:hypothetical protein HK105_208514 [Polyrhizophydium stewartii]|uniref:Rab-GAP TBC domain-containing protein n=1 Tax=Polyrhizophydium stewartii TaxID=2732419 RepID=A0ABR4MXN5_9FUNG
MADLRAGDRIAMFELLVGAKHLPPEDTFDRFRRLCFAGIPDTAGIRQRAWMLLLGHLPFGDRARWPAVLRERREVYFGFVGDLITPPTEEELALCAAQLRDESPTAQRNPKWDRYVEEMTLVDQIDMDVRRTLPDLSFFQMPVPPSALSPLTVPADVEVVDADGAGAGDTSAPPTHGFQPLPGRRGLFDRIVAFKRDDDFGARSRASGKATARGTTSSANGDGGGSGGGGGAGDSPRRGGDLHWEAIERILYIFAKLNPGIGYVQGMNEILGPLYYVLATNPAEEWRAHAEPDAFFLFTALMSEFRDHFIRHLDNVASPRYSKLSVPSTASLESLSMAAADDAEHANETGIGESMNRLMRKLARVDPELHQNLNHKRISPVFFSFRWISVLFTQEFPLPDVIRIWDAVFADIAEDIVGAESLQAEHLDSSLALDGRAGASGTAGVDDAAGMVLVAGGGGRREHKFEFVIDFACAMMTSVRRELLEGAFGDNIKLLQQYPLQDVDALVGKAWEYHVMGPDQGPQRLDFGDMIKRSSMQAFRRAAMGMSSAAMGVSSAASIASAGFGQALRDRGTQEPQAEREGGPRPVFDLGMFTRPFAGAKGGRRRGMRRRRP